MLLQLLDREAIQKIDPDFVQKLVASSTGVSAIGQDQELQLVRSLICAMDEKAPPPTAPGQSSNEHPRDEGEQHSSNPGMNGPNHILEQQTDVDMVHQHPAVICEIIKGDDSELQQREIRSFPGHVARQVAMYLNETWQKS